MQPSSASNSYSNITIQFGDVAQGSSEVELLAKFFLNSQKNENIRFNVQEFLNHNIPEKSFLIEIDAAEDAEDLAQKIKEIKENSESMKQIEEEKEMDIKVIGKGNKVYIVITGDGAERTLTKINEPLSKLEFPTQNTNDHILQLHAQSSSPLEKIHQSVQENGTLIAFLQSLRINLNFPKNQASHHLLFVILSGILKDISNIETMIKTFKSFNLNVKAESSTLLQNYPDLISSLKLEQQFNDDFKAIQNLLGSKIKAYVFGKPLSVSFNLDANNLYFILDVLFA